MQKLQKNKTEAPNKFSGQYNSNKTEAPVNNNITRLSCRIKACKLLTKRTAPIELPNMKKIPPNVLKPIAAATANLICKTKDMFTLNVFVDKIKEKHKSG